MQAKTIVPLRDPGDYTLEIRDATADLAGPDFQYRVQVRPQIPHVGQVRIDTDHLNLAPGRGENDPCGVRSRRRLPRRGDRRCGIASARRIAAVGADFEPDKDPPPAIGKRERYTPRTERAVVVLSASADALPTAQPQSVRLVSASAGRWQTRRGSFDKNDLRDGDRKTVKLLLRISALMAIAAWPAATIVSLADAPGTGTR